MKNTISFQKTSNLVFIDTKVQNYQQLFDGIVSGAIPFAINTVTDGIQQINQVLEQYPGKKTVHIISHGAPGCLYLGNSELSLKTLKQYTPIIEQWNIDNLLLYGCHVASGDAGEEFVNKLQTLTGSNISASKSLTGAAVKGGNWNLEFTTSQDETSLALSEATIVAYNGVLQLLHEDDYAALKALYQSTDGANWNNNYGWNKWKFNSSIPPNTSIARSWYGVTLLGNRVSSFHLDDNNLTGEIPKELGNLSNLSLLYLYDNNLTGEIPKELGNLSTLDHLYLYDNNLTGEIPKELGNLSNLSSLFLSDNNLTGEIPKELGNLSNLFLLYLWDNKLTGEIPKELSKLSNLSWLHLDNNILTNEIPKELGNLSNLESLHLGDNNLTGEIPKELGNLSTLDHLYLYDNKLTGEIPKELGNLSNLSLLDLSNNKLTGEIPKELGNLSNLSLLYLSSNKLTGEIPKELGEIPKELGDLSNLSLLDLDLSSNKLTGEIPKELGNLSNLSLLYLYDNKLTGKVPKELGNLSNLSVLDLSDNELTGKVPKELGNLSNLSVLDLSDNELTGKVPDSINNLSAYKRLNSPPYLKTDIPDQNTTTNSIFNLNISNNFGDINEDISNYSAEGLPDGLKLDSETGIIRGTPTVAGDYAITITVSDSQSPPEKIEEEFNIKIENDKPIGSPFTIIEEEGTASFAKDKNDGTYWIINGEKELQLQNRQGKTYSDKTTSNWNAVAVELDPKSENSYRVLLQGQNARSDEAYVWTTNSDGVITKGSGWKSEDALLPIEEEFNIDLNNDELIGSPFTIIENEGTATFAKDKNGNYLIIDEDKKLQLQNRQGRTYSDNATSNWNAVAVELDPKSENSYRVLLQGQNARSDQAYIWTTNSEGVITKGSGWKSEDALLPIEEEFNIDLNNDELIGSPFTIIENEGTATFAKDKNGNYLIIDEDKKLQLRNRQGKTYSDNTTTNWNAVAVELDPKSENSYRVLLQGQNTKSDQAYIWTTNSEGVITKGSGWKSEDDLLPFEQEFNIDLNGDSLIS